MASNVRLVRIGGFELRLQHLLIIGILAAAVSISFMLRSQPADYGYELNEFDPFFNYRATQFIVDNGFAEYFSWHDDMSWHPKGRNVSGGSQVVLHATAAYTYFIFGGSSSLYDFIILFPVVFGSMTAIIVFALVRVLGGTTAGLFAALLFAVSTPILIRGTIGWFKSEPLGLFYGMLAVYLFLSGINSRDKRVALPKLIGGGVILALGLSAWGGIQFFVMPIALFILVLPLLRKDLNFLFWAIPVFAASFLLAVANTERPGIGFVTGFGGMLMIGSSACLAACMIVQRISGEEKRIRNTLVFLGGVIAAGISVFMLNSVVQFLTAPSFRYLNAINPFLTTVDPLVDSVSEHATTTLSQSFFFLSVMMIFAAIGAWLIFNNKKALQRYATRVSPDMTAFALIIGILGAYISSAFIRLELFASISVIVLASIGLSILASEVLKPRIREKQSIKPFSPYTKISFVAVVIALLVVPTVIPTQGNWVSATDVPPTILNGGTNYRIAVQDWPDTLEWIKNNTPPDSIIASWWDYGYWITTLGERTTLADNATIDTIAIQGIARMLLASPDEAWRILQEMEADYVLIFVAATKLQNDPLPLYILTGGGDESKKQWFIRIAQEEPIEKYLHPDMQSGTKHFWEDTLLGNMMAFSPLVYVNAETNQQSETYRQGYTAVYQQDVKYPVNGTGPLTLAYSSASFERETQGPITAVLIYKVNPDYTPEP